jgi:hypothetical protein
VPAPPWIPIIVGLALVAILGIALLTSLVRGDPIDVSALALVAGGWGVGVWITDRVLRAVDRRLWRSVPFRWLPLPHAPPVLHGTWVIDITTHREGAAAPKAPTAEYGYLVVDQEFSTIWVRLLLAIGTSDPTLAILARRGKTWELSYFYDFIPDPNPRGENPRRWGAAVLRVWPLSRKLEGTYWNQLGWKGGIVSCEYVDRLFDDFTLAEAHFRRGTITRRLSNRQVSDSPDDVE